jgi:ring-1,2-phenylacetyl-CoA epoxidase subunit PaaC
VNPNDALLAYVTRLGDNALILGQRMVELVAAYPELEEELANANFALDYIGQARMFYTYAGELEGKGRGEDDFAFLRDEHEFHNYLLLEQPNGHFGDSITRLVLFETFYLAQLEALTGCADERLAGIAARAEKEIRYHLRHNVHWLVRLGDGTDDSHERVQGSVDSLWQFTGELFAVDDIDRTFAEVFGGPHLDAIYEGWRTSIAAILKEATLTMPEDGWMAAGGKSGRHSEYFGYLIAEMQHLQRAHPGATW